MSRKTARRKSWKADASHRKTKKLNKLAVAILGAVLLLFVFGFLFNFIKNINSPLIKNASLSKYSSWDGQSNLNLVIKSEPVVLLSLNPTEQTVFILKLPGQTYLDVPGGFGFWPLRSVFDLGQSEKPPAGVKLLKQSISSFLGIPIDGYLNFPKSEDLEPQRLVEEMKNPLFVFTSKIESDLSIKEILSLSLQLGGVRFDKIKEVDLESLDLLQQKTLADGTEGFEFDPTQIDSLAENFHDPKIITESLTIAVFNGTSMPGLAQKAARLITNMGGNVIISTNADPSSNTVVLGEESFTKKRLAQIFHSDCSDNLKCDTIACKLQNKEKKDQCQIPDPKVLESRAQINVVLGEDNL